MVGADHALHVVADVVLVFIRGFHEAADAGQEGVLVEGDGLSNEDQVIVGLSEAFFRHELLFVELLAGTEAGVFDLDVDVRLKAAEFNEVPGEGVDLHGRSHIKHEDLAALCIGAGEEHEAHGLRDGHEVADDVRRGDGHRTALRDLPLKNRNDGAIGTEDIAETYRDELSVSIGEHGGCDVAAFDAIVGEELGDLGGAAGFYFLVEGLDDHLAEALRGAHDVCRVHGLVGRNEHETVAAMNHRGVGRFVRADDIVLNGLAGGVFHEGHVFVRGGVVDDLRVVFLEEVEHLPAVADGADEHLEVKVRVFLPELELDTVRVVFVDVEDDELLRLVACDLPAEFRSNASTTACHEDCFSGNELEDFGEIGTDRLTAEEVFDGDVPHLGDADLAGDELVHAGELLQLAAGFLTDV